MDILELMAVLSFGLTCFGIGYSTRNSCWASVDADVLLYVQYATISKVPQAFLAVIRFEQTVKEREWRLCRTLKRLELNKKFNMVNPKYVQPEWFKADFDKRRDEEIK